MNIVLFQQVAHSINLPPNIELVNDNKLPFVDTLVTLNNNSFSTNLFGKKTFIGRSLL